MATSAIIFNIKNKVEKVAEHSLVADSEITKLSAYPSFSGEEGLNARITAIETAIGTSGSGDSLGSRMTDAETAINLLNGDSSTSGSVAHTVASAKALIDAYTVNGYAINTSPVLSAQDIAITGFTPDTNSALTGITAASTASAAIDKIDEILAVITGSSSVTGSIAKAEADAKAYADGKIAALGSVFNYKGTKASLAELQALDSGNAVGDVWHIADAGTNGSGAEYVCNAVDSSTGIGTWEELGTAVDLSGYYTKVEVQGFTINGKAIYTSPTLNGSDIALGSGYSAISGSVLTGIATGSTIDAALDKIDEVLKSHDTSLSTIDTTLNGTSVPGEIAYEVTGAGSQECNGTYTKVSSVPQVFAEEATVDELYTNGTCYLIVGENYVSIKDGNNEYSYYVPDAQDETKLMAAAGESPAPTVTTTTVGGSVTPGLVSRVSANEAAITTLTGNDSTVGSVAYAVKAEETARKEELAAELLKYHTDYTAFEVLPHTTTIAQDSVISDTILAEGITDTAVLNSVLKNDIAAKTLHRIKIRTNQADPSKSDIIIDWGDGTRSSVAHQDYEAANSSIDVANNEGEYVFSHDYAQALTEENLTSKRYTVKVFGKQYYNISHRMDSAGTLLSNIMYKCFEGDLCVASNMGNLSNFCFGSDVLVYASFEPIKYRYFENMQGLFTSCHNLVKAIGFGAITSVATCGSFFSACSSLTTTDFVMPMNTLRHNSLEMVFNACTSLTKDISTLFPKVWSMKGVSVSASGMFKWCNHLTGTVPAHLLWENQDISWTNTATAFSDSAAEIRAQVPTSWGGTNTEIQAKLDAGYYNKVIKNDVVVVDQKFSNKLSYEFINTNTTKTLEDKLYVVRGACLTATLPSGNAIPANVQIRVIVNAAASTEGGTVAPGTGDTVNGASTAFALDDVMDVTFIYDSANHDWLPIVTTA